jgi:hypothetical protein
MAIKITAKTGKGGQFDIRAANRRYIFNTDKGEYLLLTKEEFNMNSRTWQNWTHSLEFQDAPDDLLPKTPPPIAPEVSKPATQAQEGGAAASPKPLRKIQRLSSIPPSSAVVTGQPLEDPMPSSPSEGEKLLLSPDAEAKLDEAKALARGNPKIPYQGPVRNPQAGHMDLEPEMSRAIEGEQLVGFGVSGSVLIPPRSTGL